MDTEVPVAVSLALLYHGGWCSSCISARMIASRKPANIPAKCPTKSTLGEMDIMMHEVHLEKNIIGKPFSGRSWLDILEQEDIMLCIYIYMNVYIYICIIMYIYMYIYISSFPFPGGVGVPHFVVNQPLSLQNCSGTQSPSYKMVFL